VSTREHKGGQFLHGCEPARADRVRLSKKAAANGSQPERITGFHTMEASKIINYETVESVNVSLTVAMVNNFVLNTSSFLNKYAKVWTIAL
jgi:hypothetical protein